MHLSTIIVSTLAVVASAAPSYPKITVKDASQSVNAYGRVSTYFNLLAAKVQASKLSGEAPVCDLSNVQMPTDSNGALPAVSDGLKVKHVAVGRGTQNYTCDTSDPSAAPTQVGALATLFNASCVASLYPDLLLEIPGMAVHFNISSNYQLGPAQMSVSGKHYFRNSTTPFFNLDTESMDLGEAPCAKNSSVNAPPDAPVGQQGDAAVPWLKLTTLDGATGELKEVYRVQTAGGSAPATCDGMASAFQIQYSALYYFFEGDSTDTDSSS